MKQLLGIASLVCLVPWCVSCNGDEPNGNGNGNGPDTIKPIHVEVPVFNSDSAYAYIERQVSFGPRVPGTAEHDMCGVWLEEQLRNYTSDNVIVQRADVRLFTGEKINLRNIIGSFNPDEKRRVLLCAHWDSRMFADHDSERRSEPIDGANDGASGVGVLLEVARHLSTDSIANLGIDIILFDAEDQGFPDNMPEYERPANTNETWGLGSQYWSRHRHRMDARYQYGVLLDMVGGENATFHKDFYSLYFAPNIVDKVWKEAQSLGYDKYFLNTKGHEVLDDHYFVNTIASIPTIDIIQTNPDVRGFHPSWHTHGDNLSVISLATLKAVGQTVLSVIYKEAAGALPL